MSNLFSLAGVVFLYMSGWFLVSIFKRRNDVADVAWGPGFVLLAWTAYGFSLVAGLRGFIVAVLVTVWGLRLAWHIHKRQVGKPEDYRYRVWREAWGKWFYLRSYLQVFLLQGGLLILVAAPIVLVNLSSGKPFGLLDVCGVAVWLFGFVFEAVGDAQLAWFLQNPANKGKLMQKGLWAYTRHPNYFGEIMQWWGIWLLALSVPHGWWGMIGPLTITYLIVRVSGIPMLEKKMAQHPDFAAYKQRVSMFIPLPKKF